ncbi:MAG: BMP family protein [Exilispira sp.]
MKFKFKKVFFIFLTLSVFFILINIHNFDNKLLFKINNTAFGQSIYTFNPQNTTIALISGPEGFTQFSIAGEILKGLLSIKKEFFVSIILYTLNSYDDLDSLFQEIIINQANIIISYGNEIRNDFKKLAIENPDRFFIGIDMFSKDIELQDFSNSYIPANLCMVTYKEEEAGFLAGVFAGLITKDFSIISNRLNNDNVVGIIVANPDDSKYRYEFGFRLGLLSINDKCEILEYKIKDENDFYLIRKNTASLYQNKADIVFQLCGKGSGAAIQAAYLGGNYIIGYEFDQNIYAPENVVTSAIKKIASSIYYLIKNNFLNGFSNGILRLGIKDGAVGLASFHQFDLLIPEQIKKTLYTLSSSIAEGKINIPYVSYSEEEKNIQEDQQINDNTDNSSDENLIDEENPDQ